MSGEFMDLANLFRSIGMFRFTKAALTAAGING